jgi:hypothetical protein
MTSTSGPDSLEFYEKNGCLFVEDASIGDLVVTLEGLGLPGDAILDRAKPALLKAEVSHTKFTQDALTCSSLPYLFWSDTSIDRTFNFSTGLDPIQAIDSFSPNRQARNIV